MQPFIRHTVTDYSWHFQIPLVTLDVSNCIFQNRDYASSK